MAVDKTEGKGLMAEQPQSSFEVEQSVPTLGEMTGRSSSDNDIKRRGGGAGSRCHCFAFDFVLLIVGLLIVSIGLAVGLAGRETMLRQQPPKEAPKLSEEEAANRLKEVMDFLEGSGVAKHEDFEVATSPQSLAATHLAVKDPLFLDVPHSSVPRDGYQFITRYVLSVLYYALNGEDWANKKSFMSSLPTCDWWEINLDSTTSRMYKSTGVICNKNKIITDLLLPEMELEGTLPEELGLLTTLKTMVFDGNLLKGGIPDSFAQLSQLDHLWLARNHFDGTLPSWINNVTHLVSLDVSQNRMQGTLPDFSNLALLEMLAVDKNFFTGRLDTTFSMKNNSDGGGLHKLKYLYLDGNDFQGPLGDDFMDMPSASPLMGLDISNNALTGTIPSHLFAKFPNLLVFDANSNMLNGRLPASISTNNALEFLALFSNMLTGEVPGAMGDLAKLTHLDLSQNQFTAFSADLGRLTKLDFLFLASNPLPAGPFPTYLSSLTNLEELSVKNLQLNGTIPSFLGDMKNMVLLDLDGNNLSGSIPSWVGGLSNLEFLLLNRNMLTSTVPNEIGNLPALRLLFLDNNDLSGNVDFVSCDNSTGSPIFVVADCGGGAGAEVTCPCCDKCCSDKEPCNDDNFVPNEDPTWQFGYDRTGYFFGTQAFQKSP